MQSLEYCRRFLLEKTPHAVIRASQTIAHSFKLLATNPGIGRPLDDLPELRELIIPFGDAGYVALYRLDVQSDVVYILAFRHQKEASF